MCIRDRLSSFDVSVLNLIPNWAVNMDSIQPPNFSEVHKAVNQMASRKATEIDGLLGVVFKDGGPNLIAKLTRLFQNIWSKAVGSAGIQRCTNCAYLQEERRPLSV